MWILNQNQNYEGETYYEIGSNIYLHSHVYYCEKSFLIKHHFKLNMDCSHILW